MIVRLFGKVKSSKSHHKVKSWKPIVRSFFPTMVVLVGLFFILFTSGCGGGGSSSSSTADSSSTTTTSTPETTGYEVPEKISVIPTSETARNRTSASLNRSLRASFRFLARAAADPDTDYSKAETRRYVEEHSLEQFDTIEQVLNALDQTYYGDAGNIGADPYKVMVAWEDKEEGRSIKQLEPWVIESDQIEENGQNILRVRAWIEEQGDAGPELIKAEFKIYNSPTKKDDGSYADFGVWTINVKFDELGVDNFFVATATLGDSGEGVLKVHEKFSEGHGPGIALTIEMKAILQRASDTEGYGQVSFPDWEAIFGHGGTDPGALTSMPTLTAKYAYNENYLAVQETGEDVRYNDRNSVTEMTHRYGIYHGETGQDVMKTKSFGFPIRFTVNNISGHGYYGAWQGRHEIWGGPGGNVSLSEGTTVTREDTPPDQDPETYTVGPTYNGTLSKRSYVNADLNDIKNIPVEIWINQDYSLNYDTGDGKWYQCPQMNWATDPPSCATTPVDFAAEIGYASLIVGAEDTKKFVGIGGWDQTNNTELKFVYELANDTNGNTAGFYKASEVHGDYGMQMVADTPRVALNTDNVQHLWIWVGGSIYVEWKGTETGWVEKELINFNQMTWTPEFNESGDKSYTLPEKTELYINMQGANYVAFKENGVTTVKLELQSVANPTNATTVVPSGTVFKDQWDPDANSTYQFITDSADANFLMLVWLTIGDNDKDSNGQPNQGVAVGAVVTNQLWGLEAFDGSVTTGNMFNWEYSGDGGWGSVTYLKNADGSYKLLHDPLLFTPIEATNGAKETKTLSLQYDGWMMGLPDMYMELEKNNWSITADISNKIINLPAGTVLTESSSGTVYVLKPLEVSQFLNAVAANTAGVPDITAADSVDLSTVPDYVEHGMGDMPADTVVKYSEGKPVE